MRCAPTGVGELLLDLLAKLALPPDAAGSEALSTPSLLLLGPPGAGKTTLLRDVAGLLANRRDSRFSARLCSD